MWIFIFVNVIFYFIFFPKATGIYFLEIKSYLDNINIKDYCHDNCKIGDVFFITEKNY